MWFSQMEAQFAISGISNEFTCYVSDERLMSTSSLQTAKEVGISKSLYSAFENPVAIFFCLYIPHYYKEVKIVIISSLG